MLVLKTHSWEYAHTDTGKAALLEALNSVGGLLLPDLLPQTEMNTLTHLCDCYVSLHRCEGFGLGIAEAMSLGKPVIATDYSGNSDFMREDNSYPVSWTRRQITLEDHRYQPIYVQVYEPGQWWAEPDLDHAASLMRQVYTQQDEARATGQRARDFMREHHSYQKAGEHIRARLEAIIAQQPR